jgi:hypothetical protein
VRISKRLGEFALAGLSVLSLVALVFWLVAALESHTGVFAKQSLDAKLVIALILLWLTTFVWGLRRGRGGGGEGGPHVHQSPLAPGHEEDFEIGGLAGHRAVKHVRDEPLTPP